MSVTGFFLPSVVGASGANVMPGAKRFPSADLSHVLDHNGSVRRTSVLHAHHREPRPGDPTRDPAETLFETVPDDFRLASTSPGRRQCRSAVTLLFRHDRPGVISTRMSRSAASRRRSARRAALSTATYCRRSAFCHSPQWSAATSWRCMRVCAKSGIYIPTVTRRELPTRPEAKNGGPGAAGAARCPAAPCSYRLQYSFSGLKKHSGSCSAYSIRAQLMHAWRLSLPVTPT